MSDKTLEVRESFAKALAEVSDAAELDKLRVEYLGKKGLVTDLMKDMKSLSIEEKKTFGQAVNVLKDEITAAIAANSAALTLANLQYAASGAVQSTMIAAVGQCIGAGEKKQAIHYARSLTGVGYALISGAAVLLCLLAPPLLAFFNLSDEAFSLARTVLFYHSAASILIYPIAFCLPAAFRAASDVKFTMLVSIFSMWIFRVALTYFLVKDNVSFFGLFTLPGLALGLMGVWIAMSTDWIFRASLFLWRFLSGKWLTKYKD